MARHMADSHFSGSTERRLQLRMHGGRRTMSWIRSSLMLKDFKAFVMRGNVLDLAVAVIIGAAFGAIVTSLVNDVIMPPIGLVLGKVDFKDLFVSLNGQSYPTLAA